MLTFSSQLHQVVQHFQIDGTLTDIKPIIQGNINKTFLVTFQQPHGPARYILQSLNRQVFEQPTQIIANAVLVTTTLKENLHNTDWQTITFIQTHSGKYYHEDNDCWRMSHFIENSVTFDEIQNDKHAQSIGKALGHFHQQLLQFDPLSLYNHSPLFHNTARIFSDFANNLDWVDCLKSDESLKFCGNIIEQLKHRVNVLEDLRQLNALPVRVIHGDPKINNILFYKDTLSPIGMIDLDCIMPGLIHYDIGDCLRSACNRLGEETLDFDAVKFDTSFAQHILQSYSEFMGPHLSPSEWETMHEAIWLIPFELGIRFLSDYLNGNKIFRVTHPKHNLNRALVQFHLTKSVLDQLHTIRQHIQALENEYSSK